MKYYLTLLLFMSFKLQAQQSENWAVGLNVSPDLDYRFLTKTGSTLGLNYYLQRKETELPKMGYHVSAMAVYKTDGKLMYEAGLGFSSLGFKTKFAPAENDWPGNMRTKRAFYYAELPLSVSYTGGEGARIQFIASASLIPALAVGRARTYDFDSMPDDKYKGFDIEGFHLFSSISSGVIFNVTEVLSLRLCPEFKVDLFKEYGNSHLWSLGFNCGIYYSL